MSMGCYLLTCVWPVSTEQAGILVRCLECSRYCDWTGDGTIAVQFSTGTSLFFAVIRLDLEPTQQPI
jgi:hypothetical protein